MENQQESQKRPRSSRTSCRYSR